MMGLLAFVTQSSLSQNLQTALTAELSYTAPILRMLTIRLNVSVFLILFGSPTARLVSVLFPSLSPNRIVFAAVSVPSPSKMVFVIVTQLFQSPFRILNVFRVSV